MENLESENVSLEFQVQSLIKERENVKIEYQKLFDSIKRARTQTQGEINELIENVNQKTYAYANVRAQNQDLLITISELKAKLKNVEKGLRAISSVRRPSHRDSSFKNSVLSNTKNSSEKVENALITKNVLCVSYAKNVLIPCHDNYLVKCKLNVHSKVRRALFTTSRTVKSKFEDPTLVVSKTSFSVKTVQSKSLDTTPVVSKTKIAVVTPLSAKHKVSSAFNVRDSSLSNYIKNKIRTSRMWQKRLDNLFELMYEEYFEKRSLEMSINSAAQQVLNNEDSPLISSIVVEEHEAPPIVTTSEEKTYPISFNEADEFNHEDCAYFDGNTVFVPYDVYNFEEAELSTTTLDPSNMHEFHQLQPLTHI
ncbi:hypothetical protein Tco_1095380 [Tanacetum coccineum]